MEGLRLLWLSAALGRSLEVAIVKPTSAATAIHDIVYWENFGIGCIALIMHPRLAGHDKHFLSQVQKCLTTDQLVQTMVMNRDTFYAGIKQRCLRQTTIVVVMSNDPGIYHLLLDAVKDEYFMMTMYWLVLMRSNENDSQALGRIQDLMETTVNGINIDMASSVLVLDLDSGYLCEIYRIIWNGPLKMNQLAQWQGDYFTWLKMRYSMIRSQLNGTNIKAVVQNTTISQIILNRSTGAYELVGGIYAKVWKHLESRMNFTTNFQPTNLSGWEESPEDGKWQGIESWLEDNLSEAIVSPVITSPIKQREFFITWAVYEQRYYIFVRDPNSQQTVPWNSFWIPFSVSLWIALISTIIIIALVLFFIIQTFKPQSRLHSLAQCLFFSYRVFCNQGQEEDPKVLSSRIVILTAYLTSVLIVTSYSGVLISFLATDHTSLPFDSWEAILSDASYQLGVIHNSGVHVIFKQSKNRYIRQIWEKLMNISPLNFPLTLEEAWKRVCGERFAFIFPIDHDMPIFMDDLPCRIRVIEPTFIKIKCSLAFSKNFPYKSLIRYHLQDLRNSGILSRLYDEWEKQSLNNFHGYIQKQQISVEFIQVSPLIIFYSLGLGASLIILIIEQQRKFCQKKNKS